MTEAMARDRYPRLAEFEAKSVDGRTYDVFWRLRDNKRSFDHLHQDQHLLLGRGPGEGGAKDLGEKGRGARGSRNIRGGARVIPSPTWWVRGQSGYTQAGATRDGHESHTSICISCQTHRGMRTHARMCVRVFFCITTQTGHVRLIPQNPFKRDPVVSVARGSSLCPKA